MVTVYTKPYCPYCLRAKHTLEAHNIAYKEIVLEDTEQLEALKQRTGHQTVPQVFAGETFIGGSDDLEEQIDTVLDLVANQKTPE